MGGFLRAIVLAIAIAAPAFPVSAQQLDEVRSPILTLDQERFFVESAWGKRAMAEIEAVSTALAAENRQIEAELTVEEKSLTEQRATLSVENFRAAADAFDAKVTMIRQQQDGKARDVGRMRDTERQQFYRAALPVMGEVMRSRGAVAILDARAIFISADVIDATDEMIATVDERVGAGPGNASSELETAPPAINGTDAGAN